MDFAPVPVRIMQMVNLNGKEHEAGDVVTVDHLLAAALIDAGYGAPLGGEVEPELRPIRGRFKPTERRP